jgi:hypothetical protein
VTSKDASNTVLKQVEYAYDVFDRRIAKRVDANGDSTFEFTERYAYDGDSIALVFDGAARCSTCRAGVRFRWAPRGRMQGDGSRRCIRA